jgi:hypothetical protein
MDQFQFDELCDTTSKALGLADNGELSRTGQISLDGVLIGIFHDPDVDDAIHCYVDLGRVQTPEREDTFARALSLNLSLDGANGESIGFDGDSSKLVLRSKIPVDPAPTGEQMAVWFRDYSAFAHAFHGDEVLHAHQMERDRPSIFALA